MSDPDTYVRSHQKNYHNRHDTDVTLPRPAGGPRLSSIDSGCGGHCTYSLTCPYPVCMEDVGGIRAVERIIRSQEIFIRWGSGAKVKDLASEFGISEKQVYSVLNSTHT
jgi:hypothetical protein